MIDLGDVFRVAVDVRDADGTLASPTSAELTVTLPDGTTVSPAVPLPPAEVGKVVVDYPTVQAGRHVYRLTTAGPVSAYADMFEVAAADPGQIVSLADAKAHLNIPATSTNDDEELRSFVAAATAVVERYVGAVVRRDHTEVFEGGRVSLLLSHRPVLSVASVTGSGTAVDYTVDSDAGVVRLASAAAGEVEVAYTAGRTSVAANYSRAALIIVKHMWETQRNTSGARPQLGESDLIQGAGGSTFAIPYRALELLGEPVPGIA